MSTSAPYLKKDDKGTWYIHWTENRIGKRISSRSKDLARAKEFLATWLVMDAKAPAPDGAGLTLSEVWSKYFTQHVLRNAGQYGAEQAWKQLQPHFGALAASGLTQSAVDLYVNKRTTGRLGRLVKPHTVTKELAYIRAAVKFCADPRRKIIPAEFANVLTLPAQAPARDRWLRTEEIQKLLDAAARMRAATGAKRLSRVERFLWLALETAGRKSAILDLTWGRVDFETNVIRLDVPDRKKTKKRRATVPMSKALRPIMERAFAERLDPRRADGLVMDNKGEVWDLIQQTVLAAGLAPSQPTPIKRRKRKATGISPHVMRHTAATHMARRKVPLYIIAEILGNSLKMVAEVYGHHAKDDLQHAVDAISGATLEAAE